MALDFRFLVLAYDLKLNQIRLAAICFQTDWQRLPHSSKLVLFQRFLETLSLDSKVYSYWFFNYLVSLVFSVIQYSYYDSGKTL